MLRNAMLNALLRTQTERVQMCVSHASACPCHLDTPSTMRVPCLCRRIVAVILLSIIACPHAHPAIALSCPLPSCKHPSVSQYPHARRDPRCLLSVWLRWCGARFSASSIRNREWNRRSMRAWCLIIYLPVCLSAYLPPSLPGLRPPLFTHQDIPVKYIPYSHRQQAMYHTVR